MSDTAEAPEVASRARCALRFDAPPRATLGCIQLPTDLTLDEEGPALMARVPGVRLRLQKLELDGPALDLANYESGRGRIARAAKTLLPIGSLDVLGLACTSLSFALGPEQVRRELLDAHPRAQATDMATALLAALDSVGSQRPALLTPYVDELHQQNLRLLRESGREVVADHNLRLTTDERISAISQASVRELALAVDTPDADALIVGCSAFRACTPGFLEGLEAQLGKPVLSSQQAFLWHLLRLAGVEDRVPGYGALWAAQQPLDRYPSRVSKPRMIERIDPVVSPGSWDRGPLRREELEQYEGRGVLVRRQVFTPDEVEVLRDTTRALREHYESLSYDELDRSTDMRVITERGGSLVEDGGGLPILKSIWQIHLPPEFAPHMRCAAELARRTICDARLVDAARQLLGSEVYVHQSRINFQRGLNEHSRGGSGFLWHQDFEQWHCEDGMPRMRAVSMAILLERAVPANGALMVMPGSHRRMLQARSDPADAERYARGALSRGPELTVEHLRQVTERHGIEYCAGEPGDVVLFDCNTMHGSHTNISPWDRCMLFAVYNAVTNLPAARPFAASAPRPEHIGSHDRRFAGVPLPSLQQDLTKPAPRMD